MLNHTIKSRPAGLVVRCLTAGVCVAASLALQPAAADSGRTVFLGHAVEHADNTVTLPMYSGRGPNDEEIFYVILDSSDGKDAAALGVNHSAKLNNARNSQAVMHVTSDGGTIRFPATVTFGIDIAVDTPPFLPPATVHYHAKGDEGYSPLIQLPDGTVRNAPQIAKSRPSSTLSISPFLPAPTAPQIVDSSQGAVHPKVTAIDFAAMRVTLRETDGFSGGKAVKYVSTDASVDLAAALEDATFVSKLGNAPGLGNDGTDSSRASLALFTNGQTGADNPQRQGVASALKGEGSPLNVLAWNPSQGRYSPMWDVFPAEWTPTAIASGQRLRQTDFGKVGNLAEDRRVTGPGGSRFGAAGIIVVCPIVSSD
jgi:hypothetical protein